MFYQKREKGVFLLFTAILLPLIFICVAFAVDIGYAYAGKSKLQNAADASVLAGGYQYDNGTTAVRSTINTYLQNDVGSNKYTINSITYGKKDNDETNAVLITVTVTQDQPTFFSKIIGMGKIPVTVKSSALVVPKKENKKTIFSYALFGGHDSVTYEMDDQRRYGDFTYLFQSAGNVIHGPVYTNGSIALPDNWSNTYGRYVYLDPGAFSTYVASNVRKIQGNYDYWLWTNGRAAYWEHTNAVNSTSQELKELYKDDIPKITTNFWGNRMITDWLYMYRMAYSDGTKVGKNVVVDDSVVTSTRLSAALSTSNQLTKPIVDYINSVRNNPNKYGKVYYNTSRGSTFNRWESYDVIIVSGDITFNPNNYAPTKDHVVLISLNGDITINSPSNGLKALVYAPNGLVTYNSWGNLEGSIVADRLNFSSSQTITQNDFGFDGGATENGGSTTGSVKLYEDTAGAYSSTTNI